MYHTLPRPDLKGGAGKFSMAARAAARKPGPDFLKSYSPKHTSPLGVIPQRPHAMGFCRPRAEARMTKAGGGFHRLARDCPIVPHGLWRLKEARRDQTCTLVLCKAESDCQTLWDSGFAALALPGATVNRLNATHLRDILRVFVHQSLDAGGKTFVQGLARRLVEIGFQGEIRIFLSPDPSAILRDNPADFPLRFQEILDASKPRTVKTTRRQQNQPKEKTRIAGGFNRVEI